MSAVSDTPDTGHTPRPLPGAQSSGRALALPRALKRRWNDAEIFTAPPRSEWPLALRRARTIGFVLLGVQLLVFFWWSAVMAHRFALTSDYSAYEQAAWLIGHGHFDPYSSVLRRVFWHNDTELILWPLAVFVRISPSLLTLPWLQDLALVAGEGIALAWICDLVAARHTQRRQSTSMSVALVALAIVLLVGNPWTIWTASYDFHLEAFITLFSLGAARDLHRGRRTLWIWVGLGLLCGAVGASYMGAVGVSAALSGRVRLRRGVGILMIGFGMLVILEIVHGANVAGLMEYASIVTGKPGAIPPTLSAGEIVKAAIEHPGRVVDALWTNRANIWGNMSPGGVLGLVWLPLTAPILLVTAESGFGQGGMNFSLPGFQNIAIPVMITVGTVGLLAALASRPAWRSRRRRWVVLTLIAAMMLNSVAWSIVWLPQVATNWLSVTPGAVPIIKKLQKEIAPGDEVAVSQGFSGAFAQREWIYPMLGAKLRIPIHAHKVWIIVSPSQGIENPNVSGEYADIAALSANPQMHLVAASDHIWAFEWTPPAGTRSIYLKGPVQASVPAWTLAGPAGTSVRTGPKSQWHTTSNGQPGYVIDEGYWREPRGVYRADVTISSSLLANVELWDTTTGKLLERTVLHNTHGKRTVVLTGVLRNTPKQAVLTGSALWKMSPTIPPGNSLEIRVWTPGGSDRVSVYHAAVTKLSATS
jgi:Predicted membrane protein (DUF2079)